MMGESVEVVEQGSGPLWECFEPGERSSLDFGWMSDARIVQVGEGGREEEVVKERRERLNVGTSM
jgi:hypothetical protein